MSRTIRFPIRDFEGTIPEKQYGAGKVIIWDNGTWHPLGDPQQGLRDGNLKFELRGHKLQGKWVLVRMKGKGEKQEPWLLIKEKDEYARPASEFSVVDEMPDSVKGKKLAKTGKAGKAEKPGKPSKAAKPRKGAVDAPEGAVRADLPATLSPQLATLVDGPPADSEDWLFEIKFDGYRLLSRAEGGRIQLFTRNGNDWTDKLGALHAGLKKLKLPDGWYDGEIVVINAQGVPDFGALQRSFDASKTQDIVYYLFDMPYSAGHDLRDVPLEARRAQLQALLADADPAGPVRFSALFDAPLQSVVTSACQLGLEGVIAKRRNSGYQSARSADWIKLKCGQRQEFVIGGYGPTRKGSRKSRYRRAAAGRAQRQGMNVLQYAGNVGSGFNASACCAT